MEDDTLVVPATRMTNKVLHCFGGLLWEEAEVHVPNGGVNSGGVRNR